MNLTETPTYQTGPFFSTRKKNGCTACFAKIHRENARNSIRRRSITTSITNPVQQSRHLAFGICGAAVDYPGELGSTPKSQSRIGGYPRDGQRLLRLSSKHQR
jgi:hypothetical protein